MTLTRRKFLKLLGSASFAAAVPHLAFPKSGPVEIKVAFPPTMAALPLAKGSQKIFHPEGTEVGTLKERGIKLKLLPSKGPSDAARLASVGLADCGITDLSSVLYATAGGSNLKITSTAFEPDEAERYYGLLATHRSEVASLEGLLEGLDRSPANSIVLSLRQDVHYVTDQLIRKRGFEVKDSVYYSEQEDVIYRMVGLLNGNYTSAVLPEPLLTLAVKNPKFQGYKPGLIRDYRKVALPPFVFVFRQELLGKGPDLARGFYQVWHRALEETNESSNLRLLELTADVISRTVPGTKGRIDRSELTEEVADLFEVPKFRRPEPLEEGMYNSVLDWTVSKNFLPNRVPFSEVVDSASVAST